MTEYDFSQAAVDRYLATQERISKWVTHQSAAARGYSNPFTHSPSEADPSRYQFYDEPEELPQPKQAGKPRLGRSRSHSSGETVRPPPRRSQTAHAGAYHTMHPQHQYAHAHQPHSKPKLSRSQTPTPSPPPPYDGHYGSKHKHSRSQTTHAYYPNQNPKHERANVHPPHHRSQSMPMPVLYGPGGQAILPQAGKPGPTYILIPNQRRHSGEDSSRTSDSTTPSKKSLFKRLFSGFSSSHDRSADQEHSSRSRDRSDDRDRGWQLVETSPRDRDRDAAHRSRGTHRDAPRDAYSPTGTGSNTLVESERSRRTDTTSRSRTLAYVESGGKKQRRREKGHSR